MLFLLSVPSCSFMGDANGEGRPAARDPDRPNVILILADDLGYGEVGVYGQTKIRTPTLDGLARQGIRFTEFYSGSSVCAPARCTLLTGKHTGHAQVRDNYEMGGWQRGNREGQLPLLPATWTIGRMFRERGYRTCAIGKWGLGGPGSTGHPNEQGFDHWFGYLCQRQAHNYYPEHLWRNDKKVPLEGNVWRNRTGKHYAPDLMIEEALSWVRENKDRPFFLYFATPVPHVALQVPEDSLAEYRGRWPDPPYDGKKGYLPHESPRAAYAAMVTRMDRDIGRLLALIDELGLRKDTLVLFTSDNGPTFNGGTDSTFFVSTAGLRGLKCQLYEGGIRVPMIARWPGRIPAGKVTKAPGAFWDLAPTLAEIIGGRVPEDLDGVSLLDLLRTGRPTIEHPPFYWEYHSGGGWQAVRFGRWKAVRRFVSSPERRRIEVFDLEADPNETRDLSKSRPDLVSKALTLMAARTPSVVESWNFRPKRKKARTKKKRAR